MLRARRQKPTSKMVEIAVHKAVEFVCALNVGHLDSKHVKSAAIHNELRANAIIEQSKRASNDWRSIESKPRRFIVATLSASARVYGATHRARCVDSFAVVRMTSCSASGQKTAAALDCVVASSQWPSAWLNRRCIVLSLMACMKQT